MALVEKCQGEDSWVRTLVCTNTAACYPRTCAELGVTHRSVSQARGEFNRREKLNSRGWVDIHTGTIDAVWKELKKHVPTSTNNKTPSFECLCQTVSMAILSPS